MFGVRGLGEVGLTAQHVLELVFVFAVPRLNEAAHAKGVGFHTDQIHKQVVALGGLIHPQRGAVG